jgi:hypothetical protein
MEQMVKIMLVVMPTVMIKCSGLEKKKEKNKKTQGKGIFGRNFCVLVIKTMSVIIFRIDSYTIKRG